ncbi:hypothetical protein C0J52_22226 [Blattella germanica]|nr:hypothetical protein C0J52_22226 [Blattella germanica]
MDTLCVAACNRTYLGDVGKTYELELHRPREDWLPFICHLKFEAGGDDLGDLVQVSYRGGRFEVESVGGMKFGKRENPDKNPKIPVWPTTNTPLESSGFEPESPVGTSRTL